MPAVGEAAHAVVQEAVDAGVWVFGGGLAEDVEPVMVAADGTVTAGTYPQTSELDGGFAVLDVPSRGAALEWAAKLAAACRCRKRSASSCPTRRWGTDDRSVAYARHEQLDMAARLAAPDLQSRAVLEEGAEPAEGEDPATASFAEVPFAHVRQRRLTTQARQLLVTAVLADLAATLCPGRPSAQEAPAVLIER